MATAEQIQDVSEDRHGKTAGACVMVIYGAAGDLTMRKLVPALYNLARGKLLARDFVMLGVSRDELTLEAFRKKVTGFLPKDDADSELRKWFVDRLMYMQGEFSNPESYKQLAATLAKLDKEFNTGGNYLFYLSTAPMFFGEISQQLSKCGLVSQDESHWRRVIVEKPFGRDLESARALNKTLKAVLAENQIYRIDHYLGKETVQNILVFRFGNGIFEPIWNRQYIDHVQITNAETVGVEQRGGYFDGSGTLRDMVPNHMMQLISLTAMEPPASFDADAVRDEQSKVLHAIQHFDSDTVIRNAVRGQYGEGMVGKEQSNAYRAEPGVAPESRTETFAALKLNIDNWRWAGVPFYVRTGKRMKRRHTEIMVQFRRAPFHLFHATDIDELTCNQLIIHVQPEEAMSLSFGAKVPGPVMKIGSVNMNFEYSAYFGGALANTGYEVLIYDCMIGDATLFQRADMVEAGWSIVDPVLDVWKALAPRNFPNYPAGTWGPRESDALLEEDGRSWRKP
jgi:glucose-6-phosphate 1-dehydrogenase